MKINSVSIRNFRLLNNIESLKIENDITIIVGKNNTGKTSLFEIINIFTSSKENSKLSFEDFSHKTHKVFDELASSMKDLKEKEGLTEQEKEEIELKIQKGAPKIELLIEFEYDKDKDRLTSLSEFITDLNDDRNDVTVLMSYEPINSLNLFTAHYNSKSKEDIIKFLMDNISTYYTSRYYAVDKNNNYKKQIEKGFKEKLSLIATFENIRALRLLDDKKEDRNRSLALSFSKYYNDKKQKDTDVQILKETLEGISGPFKDKYNEVLKTPLDEIKKFGVHTPLTIPEITIASEFTPEDVIKHNIKYYYTKGNINLPESYNGLGYSNLIFLVLEFMTFVKQFKNTFVIDKKTNKRNAKTLTILIEEPECHMHPQMQQVFIRGIKELIKKEKEGGLDIQLIITTHSSYIIAEAGIGIDSGFGQLRYFGKNGDNHFIKDFNSFGLKNDKETFRFLKKYLTLHKCDLFFADKAIMLEGLVERVLLPQMMIKAAESLKSEYVTVLEVGGAYSHKFKELIEFIGIKTLIITDLDSVDGTGEKCSVNDGITTSNETLKQWIPEKEKIDELIACKIEDKVINDTIRVAYQINEEGENYIARSFEEAFIQRNKTLIKDSDKSGNNIKNRFSLFKNQNLEDIKSKDSFDLSPSDSAKSNFAFDIMCFDEEACGKWDVPLYIKEGLIWLADNTKQTNYERI